MYTIFVHGVVAIYIIVALSLFLSDGCDLFAHAVIFI